LVLRTLLLICDKFAAANNMCFNAAKSKYIVIPPIRARRRVVYRLGSDCNLSFSINARKIDFVESYKHLGHVINSAFDDREDIADKRGAFVCHTQPCARGRLACAASLFTVLRVCR
jgi:hypothetical protein